MSSHTLEGDFDTLAVVRPDPQDTMHPHLTPLTLRADAELKALMQAFADEI